jgi:ABC-2 type transport system permease protein
LNALEVNSPQDNRHVFSRSFWTATWLGWQIESNWTDPFLFAIYSIVKPISTAAILVVMYSIITKGAFDSPIFPYIYLGNAFYIYVGSVMAGITWAVIDDREHYKTLKYLYVAPISIQVYLFGRGVAKFVIGTMSVIITIVFGVIFLHVKIDLASVEWSLFAASLLIGVIMLAMLGLLLAGISLLIAHHVWFLGETVAGALYLFSGAIFPLEVLPPFLRWIGYLLPITYWLELLRRSLVGEVAEAFPTLSAFSNIELMGILIALTIFFGALSFIIFHWCNNRARDRGLIDMVTNY